jgi:hypothetical protein
MLYTETLTRLIDSIVSDLSVLRKKIIISQDRVIGFREEALKNSIRKIRDEIKFIEKYFE